MNLRPHARAALGAAFCAALFVSLGPLPALGQPYDYDLKPPTDRVQKPAKLRLSPIVVSPGRSRQPNFTAPRTVHSVGRDAVAKSQAQAAPEALADVPGVLVQKTNRGSGAPYLRGLVGPRNLLVVDGVRFSNATFRTGPNQYLALLDPSAHRRFEVLMGPSSVVYGSDAMGGVVSATPLRLRRQDGVSALAGLQGASADLSTSAFGSVGWRSGDASVRAGGAWRRFGTLTTGGGAQELISDYGVGSWHGRAQYDLSASTSLRVSAISTRISDAGRQDRINHGRYRWYDNASDLGWLELRHKGKGKMSRLRVVASVHRTSESVQRFRCDLQDPVEQRQGCIDSGVAVRRAGAAPTGLLTRQEEWRDDVLTPGLLVLSQWRLANHVRATIGAEAHRDQVSSTFRERRDSNNWEWKVADRGNFSEGSTYVSGGVFTTVTGDLLKTDGGELQAQVGGRIGGFSAFAADVPQFGDVAYDKAAAVGSASLRWQAHGLWTAWLSVNQGFRAPNLQESTVLGDTGSKIEVPNGDLDPESSVALEAGVRVAHKRVQLTAVAFGNRLSDTIDERELDAAEWAKLGLEAADVGTKPVVQRVNAGAGRFVGGELSLRGALPGGLAAWAQASVIRGEIDRDGGAVTARRNPPPLGGAGLVWSVPGVKELKIEAFSRFAAPASELHPSDERDLRICENPGNPGGTYKDAGLVCPGTPGWVTANLRVVYRPTGRVRFDIAGLNLLDRVYRYHGSGIGEPGRGVALTLTGKL